MKKYVKKLRDSDLTSLCMGKRGKKKVKQDWLDTMSSDAPGSIVQFEDSASASSSAGFKFKKDNESQWFDKCPNFDNEVVVTSLSDTPQKPTAIQKISAIETNIRGNFLTSHKSNNDSATTYFGCWRA